MNITEKILTHEMTMREIKIKEVAEAIIGACLESTLFFTGEEEHTLTPFTIKYTPVGFSLVGLDTSSKDVITLTDGSLSGFVKRVIYQLTETEASWDDVLKNEEVWHRLLREVGLISPKHHGHTDCDVKDIAVISDVVCFVYENKYNEFSVRPAFSGNAKAREEWCKEINSYGRFGDYTTEECPNCKNRHYVNIRDLDGKMIHIVKCRKTCQLQSERKENEAA